MAENSIRVEVYGVREAIEYLRNFENDAYKRIIRDLKVTAKPVADKVGRDFPEEPLSQWHTTGGRLKSKSRLPEYNSARVRSSVKPAVSTRKPRNGNQVGILRIQQMDGGGQVYDSAGSVTAGSPSTMGGRFVGNLDKGKTTQSVGGGNTRSRVMYPSTKKYLPEIIDAVQQIIDDFEGEVQKNINRR